MPRLGIPELGVILALMLLVFRPKQWAEIARGLRQGIKELKQAVQDAFAREEAPRGASTPPPREERPPESARQDRR